MLFAGLKATITEGPYSLKHETLTDTKVSVNMIVQLQRGHSPV
jgi:hypothetical protein